MNLDVDGCIFIYSVENRKSFQIVQIFFYNIKKWEYSFQIKALRKQLFEINGKHIPAVLIANKSDTKNKKEVSSEEGMKLASDMDDMPFFEISCKKDKIKRIGFCVIHKFISSSLRRRKSHRNKMLYIWIFNYNFSIMIQ